MADSSVDITPGSGASVDTRTEGTNGNHRQVVVLGDPATNAGVAPVDATAGLKVDLGADNDVTVSSIAAGDNNIGNVDVVTLPSIPAGTNNIGDIDVLSVTGIVPPAGEYETVAAGQTAQTLGATGGTGDYLKHLLVIPATTSPGNVIILDNATSITVFTGGASSVLTLHPFTINLEMYSVSGAWKVTTGSNVSVVAVGNFT